MSVVAKIRKEDVQEMVRHCRKMVPNFRVFDDKHDSFLMNAVDGIVYPFQRRFMDRYITTVGGRVYFPPGDIDRSPAGAMEVLGHEFIHAYDAQRLTLPLFTLWYLSFVSLAIFGLLAYGLIVCWAGLLPFAALGIHAVAVLISFKLRKKTGFPVLAASIVAAVVISIVNVGIHTLWMLAPLVFLAPIPAPGRAWAELRGYRMSVFMELVMFGKTRIETKVRKFTGPSYYWMWPFPKPVRKKLLEMKDQSENWEVNDPEIIHVFEFLVRKGFIVDQQERSL